MDVSSFKIYITDSDLEGLKINAKTYKVQGKDIFTSIPVELAYILPSTLPAEYYFSLD